MSSSGTPIDRITLATDAFAPRSSLLHLGPGKRPGLRETAQGTVVTGMVRVAGRHDDAYGTELLLAGLGAPVSGAIGAASEDP